MSPYYILPTPASQVVALKREIMHLLSTKILKTAKNKNFSIFYIFTPVSLLPSRIVILVAKYGSYPGSTISNLPGL